MKNSAQEGEFLWLISLSDLMILLFVFFVVLFSASYPKMTGTDIARLSDSIQGKAHTGVRPLDEIQKKILKWVIDRKLLESVTVAQKDDALILEIHEKVLFASGDSRLSDEGRELAQQMGLVLARIPPPFRIGVEGHTDDAPIRSGGKAADNWELSTQRALAVFHALELDDELKQRAVILGYGPMRPAAENRAPSGAPIETNRSKNRRVTIRIF